MTTTPIKRSLKKRPKYSDAELDYSAKLYGLAYMTRIAESFGIKVYMGDGTSEVVRKIKEVRDGTV